MNDFNQILLDVHPEFTDLEAVDRAAALASKTKADVKVVHVVEDYPEDMSEWWNVRNPYGANIRTDRMILLSTNIADNLLAQ